LDIKTKAKGRQGVNARIRTENGKTWIEVEYDRAKLDWSDCIAAALAAYGVRRDQLSVIIAQPSCAAGNNNATGI
jgi:hypothetical protein